MNFFKASLICLSTLLLSCSSDDSSGSNTISNFNLPLSTNNYWVYDVSTQDMSSRDSLYIFGETSINSNTYNTFKTKDDMASGFYSNSLRNNNVRKEGSKVLLTGDLSLNAGQNLPTTFDLTLDDFVIFNANAGSNQTMDSQSGTINETINEYPLTINYTLKTVNVANYSTYTSPNNDTYTDVREVKVILNASITTTLNGFPVTALTPQDVVVSTQFIADNIGVVHTQTVTSYSVNGLIADALSIPASDTQTQNEFLDVYNIN